MKYRYSLLSFLIAFILQTTVMNHFSIFQMSPNLILCLVVVYSFLYQGYHGIINGILFGLIVDVCFAEVIGIAALSNFIVSLICIELKRYLNKDSLISVVIASSVGTMAYSLLYWSIYKMLGNDYDLMYVMGKEAVLLIYHILVIAIIYQIISHSIIKHHGDRYMYRGSLQEARSLDRK
ncbi:MAG: rod shape-determining protein MreD [Eubacteriales bacterium]|nr:rod shape-determining protein MreD [Eubacteriales bacterium]MDD3199487.1 rod shape-determining protein MreD [Eubacteriales bacterium]MDD4121515.1 rod shape-determining protein MreD [Eubacteriales bacterium]MDD4629734.1 rod shape-determining protein MreD [Eubacteriales bacterium]